jgi:glycosyltransferase involved in cell wall biosynthesis
MKIAYVSDAIYPYNKGGKEKRLYELSMGLVRLGHEVHIYCMKWWDGPEKHRIENGVHLHAISKYHPMYHKDRRSIHEGIMFGFACLKLIRISFDAVDVDHMPFFPIFSMWIVCKLKRKRMYATWHEALKRSDWTHYMGSLGHIAAIVERISARLPHAITANSKHTLQLIEKELNRKKRIHYVPPGVDIKGINETPSSESECDVLYVGRLVKDKNVGMLIRAIYEISKKSSDISCVILGSGIEETPLRRLIKKYGLEDNITIIKNVPHARDVYGLMKASKVFVLPSIREGFGIVVLEALACGLPVITIDTLANASKDLIVEGESGSVVSLDSHRIAMAVQEWLSKVPNRDRIANYVSDYDWNRLAVKQLEVYSL